MTRPIRLATPQLGDEEVRALADVLASGMLVSGARVERFERALADRVGRRFALAVSSGTSALELVLEALDVRGGEVLVPALTWPSPAHAARRAGADLGLVDVDPRTWNAEPEAYAAMRTPRTRLAIAISQFGGPAKVTEIERALPGVVVIEDAACAIGSALREGPAGRFGRASTLSFHPRKVLTTGEGGMVLTDDEALAARVRRLRNHGQSAPGVFDEPGPNERMTELGAALGLTQLARLDATLAQRRALREAYRARLADLAPDVALQEAPEGATVNAQTLGVRLPPDADRDAIVHVLAARGVEAGRLSYALHRLPSLAGARLPASGLPHTEALVDRGLALPLHLGLGLDEVSEVCRALADALGAGKARPSR